MTEQQQYPSNSNAAKKAIAASETPENARTRLPPVAAAVVVTKNPIGQRVKAIFMHVLDDVLKPAARDTLNDAGVEVLNRALYPNGGGRNNINNIVSRNIMGSVGASMINYQGMSRRQPPMGNIHANQVMPQDPRAIPMNTAPMGSVDPRFIQMATRVEAQTVLDELVLQIAQYNQATVADLYDLCQMDSDFSHNKWGWTDLSPARIDHRRGVYVLQLPPTEQLAA